MNTAEKIVSLETEIAVLNAKLADATGDREIALLNAITARSQTLNALLATPTAPTAGNYFSSCYWFRRIVSHR